MIKTKPNEKRYKIDFGRPVFAYKNLHKNCWSVKQDGLVKAHTKLLAMYNCTFKVSKSGRERVLKEQRKNVHAGIEGYVENRKTVDWRNSHPTAQAVTYDPYKYENFVDKDTEQMVDYSIAVRLEPKQVLAVL
jgi:hypothetical protein|tara:strand:- start:24 stop:422 length:399 start_codon:yes stop_codon:yes gene_type:complete